MSSARDRSQEVESEELRARRKAIEAEPAREEPEAQANVSPAAGAQALTDPRFSPRANLPLKAQALHGLQRTHGNTYVQRLVDHAAGFGVTDGTSRYSLSQSAIQTEAGRGPTDAYEVTPDVAGRIERQKGSGKPLDSQVHRDMEAALGEKLADVRVHVGREADRLTGEVHAEAFTAGSHIFFREGTYQPGSESGKRLLGHEFSHVVEAHGAAGYRRGLIQRFESPEHRKLGDEMIGILGKEAAEEIGDPWNPASKLELNCGVEISYGMAMALAGDFYGSVDALRNAPATEISQLILTIQRQEKGEEFDFTTEVERITGGRYLKLAKENIDHFSPHNAEKWAEGHAKAIELAEAAFELEQGEQKTKVNEAYLQNAFADHFLTDAFAAGHISTPREELHEKGVPGDIYSKYRHDVVNKAGLIVTNDRGNRWRATGDNYLEQSPENMKMAAEAVALSRRDIGRASQGEEVKKPFDAEKLIPRAVELTGWEEAEQWLREQMAKPEAVGNLVDEGEGIIKRGASSLVDSVLGWVREQWEEGKEQPGDFPEPPRDTRVA